MNEFRYARFLRRAQALFIDSTIIPLFAMVVIVISADYEIEGKLILFMAIAIFLIFEPLLISQTGSTIGQKISGIKVVNKKNGKKLNFFSATARFFIKVIFGWISLITIFTSKKHQAFHDFIVGSVVIINHNGKVPSFEALEQRQFKKSRFTYPSAFIQVIISLLYILSLLLLLIGIVFWTASEQCLETGWCNQNINNMIFIFELLWVAAIPLFINACRRGKMLGCRRKISGDSGLINND